MRSALVALAGTAILAVSLSGCGGQSPAPASGQPEAPQSGASATGQPAVPGNSATVNTQAGSATDELAQISSTLDAIDSELAGDGSP
jgi:hypothetical protein